jgi:hypothetical protein
MRRVIMVFGLMLGLASLAAAQGIAYGSPGTPGTPAFTGTLGSEAAPAIAGANWTCGAGWDCSVAGTLNKNAAGTGTAVPNPALTIVAGTMYRVQITLGAVSVAAGATYTLGGSPGSALTAATTYTNYIIATTTANLIITPGSSGTRFTVTAVSVKAMSQPTDGNLSVGGNFSVLGTSTFSGQIMVPDSVYTAPAISSLNRSSGVIPLVDGTLQFVTANSRYWIMSGGDLRGLGNDNNTLGGGGTLIGATFTRYVQGSKSKALADNTKAAFEVVDIAAGSYGGGDVIYTLYCADASDRVSRSGRIPFAAQNTGGTETCAVGTATSSGDVTNNAKSFSTVTWTCADGGTNKIQLEVQADCSIVTPTTLTIEYRVDMPKANAVTPQT